jgi:hypothetical protein
MLQSPNHLPNQACHFARFGVAAGLQFGIYQLIVNGHLVAPAIGGHQGDGLDLRLEIV